ncbi:hypothetical protein [Hymenobacter persicinus]|uniref:Uncharacterized protein n=1 Tax=Hymenobacter persicinus TaxID=2025506 RepID=A0A4V1ZAN6_9BACT|nr:hypothetical protein [Hymenobacter persicinus]RYU78944.1 hypothetical protein EWM57_12230 [Hymenobacter persicinus]
MLELMPNNSVFSCYPYDEHLPDLESTGYVVHETGEVRISLRDKANLVHLIQQKNLLYLPDHFKILVGQTPLLEAYDRLMFAWLSNTVSISDELIARYQLTLQGESWEFLRDAPGTPDDSKIGWILLLE